MSHQLLESESIATAIYKILPSERVTKSVNRSPLDTSGCDIFANGKTKSILCEKAAKLITEEVIASIAGTNLHVISVNLHELRHTYCTMLIAAGQDAKTVQYLMGHSDPRMTMGLYAHKVDDKVLAARGAVGDYFEDVA